MPPNHLGPNGAPIIIAGGGIGGLATALALSRHGITSHVVERRPSDASDDGAGIQIGPNGVHVLRQLGLEPHITAIAAQPEKLVVGDAATGHVFTRMPLGGDMESRHGAPYLTLERRDLYAVLRNAVSSDPNIKLTLGCQVSGFSETSGPAAGVRVVTQSGEHLTGSSLIAADGLWSQLRNAIAGPTPLRPTGKCAFRTVVDNATLSQLKTLPDLEQSVHVWLSPRAHIVHYPVRAATATAIVVVIDDPKIATSWNATPDMIRLQACISATAPALSQLLVAASGWRMWSLHAMPPLAKLHSARATLLGDAAHAVLPFLAQGAVMALEDAVVLAHAMAKFPVDPQSAFSAYAAGRELRTAKVARASERNGRIYHMHGIMAGARNCVLRMSPPSALIASYDWLYGWRQSPADII